MPDARMPRRMPVDPGERPLTLRATVGRVRDLEHALHHAQADLTRANERVALAEKAAQDAWTFARTVLRSGKGHA